MVVFECLRLPLFFFSGGALRSGLILLLLNLLPAVGVEARIAAQHRYKRSRVGRTMGRPDWKLTTLPVRQPKVFHDLEVTQLGR